MHDHPVPFRWKNALAPLNVWTIAIVVFLDQAVKYLVIWNLEIGERIPLTPFLNLVHFKNKGAAFGMFHDASPTFRLVFFGLVTLVCIVFLLWSLGTSPAWDKFHRFNLSLILGGALGNVKDRVIFQQVTDFIDVYYQDYHWPAFNVADMAISTGVTLLVIRFLPWESLGISKKRKMRKAKSR